MTMGTKVGIEGVDIVEMLLFAILSRLLPISLCTWNVYNIKFLWTLESFHKSCWESNTSDRAIRTVVDLDI